MNLVSTLGIDLAKNTFSLHGINSSGAVVLQRTVSRSRLSELVAQLAGVPDWVRSLLRLPHIKRLDECFGDSLVRITCPCGACRHIEPEALARIAGRSVTLAALSTRMRCSQCGKKVAEGGRGCEAEIARRGSALSVSVQTPPGGSAAAEHSEAQEVSSPEVRVTLSHRKKM